VKNISAFALGLLLLAGCQSAGSALAPSGGAPALLRAASATPTGVVIPLYVDPGKYWDEAIAARRAHLNVPMILIANADNGPGSANASYATYIKKAQAAGILVIGYTYTQNGKRPLATVEAAISKWHELYGVTGAFLDEMAPNDPAYYTAITAYAHSHSVPFVMGNPGDNALGNSGPDVINFFEQHGYPSLVFLHQKAHVAYGKSRWSYMAGAVPFDAATISATAPYVGYMWATDDREPECYCNLPSYFNALVSLLGGINPK
jgi:Spherulation-specific family 4